jgi:hypothetical protein
MATARDDIRATGPEPPALRLADRPDPVCGECRFHIPHVATPGGWCACNAAELRWKPVSAEGPACDGFASWPEDGAVACFLAAMRR